MSVRKLPYYAQMRASPTITRDRVINHDPASAGNPKKFHTSLHKLPVIVETDASDFALGAIISQIHKG